MIYHQEGLHFDGEDPYSIEGFERDDIKTAFNIMLNRQGYKDKQSAAETISLELEVSTKEAASIEQAIQELHASIAHRFNSGDGLVLQRLDSDMALSVVMYFIEELNRPIIPIHDSFIVSVRDTESLVLLMAEAYGDSLDMINTTAVDIDTGESIAVQGVTATMRGIKGVSQEFSTELSKAILSCFEQDTDHLSDSYWAELIAKEGVNESNAIAVLEEDASDSNDMYL